MPKNEGTCSSETTPRTIDDAVDEVLDSIII
jgi:hypothetical protein